MFVFSVVYGYIIFQGEAYEKYAYLGVNMTLASLFIGSFLTSYYSQCGASMIAPHIHPTLFYAECANIISSHIKNNDSISLLPTLMITMLLGTLLVAATFYILGYFRKSLIVQLLPISVVAGFLAGIGLIIMKEGIRISTGNEFKIDNLDNIFLEWFSWKQLIPAVIMGFGLYFTKRNHISSPNRTIPAFVILPLIIYYIILWIGDISLIEARNKKYFLPKAESKAFYALYEELYGNMNHINWYAVLKTVPELLAMDFIIVIDFLLQIAGTERYCFVNMNFDKELILAGFNNIFGTFAGAIPTFSAVKCTLINYSITKDKTDRMAGYIASILIGFIFFLSLPIINYLPRFFLGGLMFYSGAAFLVKNLWDTRLTFDRQQMFTVYTILIVEGVFGVLIGVVVGVILALGEFTVMYSNQSFVTVKSLADTHSTHVRPFVHREKLEKLAETTVVFYLKGVVFFGSAKDLQKEVILLVEQDQSLPSFRRLRYLIIDCEQVTEIDSNAVNIFLKIALIAYENNFLVLFSGLSKKIHKKLWLEKILPNPEVDFNPDDIEIDIGFNLASEETDDKLNYKNNEIENELSYSKNCFIFETADLALEWCEEQLLHYCNTIRAKWLILPSMRKLNAISIYTSLKSPFDYLTNEPKVWNYMKQEQVPAGEVLCRAGELIDAVYLLQAGRVSIYLEHNDGTRKRISTMSQGACMNTVWNLPSAETIVVERLSLFLVITREKMELMEEEAPKLAILINQAILKDVVTARNRLEHEIDINAHWDGYEQMMEIRERQNVRNPDLLAIITNYYEDEDQEVFDFLQQENNHQISPKKVINDHQNVINDMKNTSKSSLIRHERSNSTRYTRTNSNDIHTPSTLKRSNSFRVNRNRRQESFHGFSEHYNVLSSSQHNITIDDPSISVDNVIKETGKEYAKSLINSNSDLSKTKHYYGELYELDHEIDELSHPSLAAHKKKKKKKKKKILKIKKKKKKKKF